VEAFEERGQIAEGGVAEEELLGRGRCRRRRPAAGGPRRRARSLALPARRGRRAPGSCRSGYPSSQITPLEELEAGRFPVLGHEPARHSPLHFRTAANATPLGDLRVVLLAQPGEGRRELRIGIGPPAVVVQAGGGVGGRGRRRRRRSRSSCLRCRSGTAAISLSSFTRLQSPVEGGYTPVRSRGAGTSRPRRIRCKWGAQPDGSLGNRRMARMVLSMQRSNQ